MRIIITGGTGLIGTALTRSLTTDGHEVIILSRSPRPTTQQSTGTRQVQWDASTANGWGHYADGADAIINLAGEGISDGRWTEARKQRIYSSRINAGKAVMEAITAATNKPKVLIQASGVDYYGPHGDEILTESAAPGSGFLPQVCFDWEASTSGAEAMGTRRAVIRTGIALSNEGGAWPRIVLPFKLFAGGPIGNGQQYWPWIHMEDVVGAIRFLIENDQAQGPFNLCAPTPLTNKEFANTLGKVMGRPAFFPVPAFVLQVIFGEMSTILLDGKHTVPSQLQALGYSFKYPTADLAFKSLT